MAKKPVRKQAPPRPGERPRGSETEAAVVEDERSIEDLVADLGSGEEPEPVEAAPPRRKSRRRSKRSEAEAVEAEPSVEAELTTESEPPPPADEHPEVEPEAAAEDGAPVADEQAEDDAPVADEQAAAEPDDRTVKLVDSLPIDVEDDLSQVEGEASPRLVSIVESLLFASSKPLRVKQIRKVLEEPSVRQIQLALKHLIA